jgi:hypothetical protein
VVGSGGGAFATAAVLAGASEVSCSDLPETLPAVEQSVTTAPPPEASYILGRDSRKVRPSQAFLTGYNYLSYDIIEPTFPHLEGTTTTIIDVQTYPTRPDLEAIARVLRRTPNRTFVRLLLYRDEVLGVGSFLDPVGPVYATVISQGAMLDVVFMVHCPNKPRLHSHIDLVTPVRWTDPGEFRRRAAYALAETKEFSELLAAPYSAEGLLEYAVATEDLADQLTKDVRGRQISFRSEQRMRRDSFVAASAAVLAGHGDRGAGVLASLKPGDHLIVGNFCRPTPFSEVGGIRGTLTLATRIAGGVQNL